jgi:hypothetical protein
VLRDPKNLYRSYHNSRSLYQRTLTPDLEPKIPNPEPRTSIDTPEPHPGTRISEFDSKVFSPSTSTEELSKPEVILSAPLDDGKENISRTYGVGH